MQYIGEYPVDTLLVKVFPDKQSAYTLWEDDGRSFDYENGKIAKTHFECIDNDKETQLIISPREGSYSGISDFRNYQIAVNFPLKPSQVLLNGNKIENWKYDNNGNVVLSFDQKNSTEKQTVKFLKSE